jgi:hypothetical protein
LRELDGRKLLERGGGAHATGDRWPACRTVFATRWRGVSETTLSFILSLDKNVWDRLSSVSSVTDSARLWSQWSNEEGEQAPRIVPVAVGRLHENENLAARAGGDRNSWATDCDPSQPIDCLQIQSKTVMRRGVHGGEVIGSVR